MGTVLRKNKTRTIIKRQNTRTEEHATERALVANQNADVGKYQIEWHNHRFKKQTTKNWQGKLNPALRADLPIQAHERNRLGLSRNMPAWTKNQSK
jgi:hypothetical protein